MRALQRDGHVWMLVPLSPIRRAWQHLKIGFTVKTAYRLALNRVNVVNLVSDASGLSESSGFDVNRSDFGLVSPRRNRLLFGRASLHPQCGDHFRVRDNPGQSFLGQHLSVALSPLSFLLFVSGVVRVTPIAISLTMLDEMGLRIGFTFINISRVVLLVLDAKLLSVVRSISCSVRTMLFWMCGSPFRPTRADLLSICLSVCSVFRAPFFCVRGVPGVCQLTLPFSVCLAIRLLIGAFVLPAVFISHAMDPF